ncbi:MAG: DUF305 domain-containing protein [Gordonia sp. (in: high G+C Gram-positive bacteria)]
MQRIKCSRNIAGLVAAGLIVVGPAVFTACGTDSASSSDGAGSSTAAQSHAASTHNAADVMFNQMMIPHHQQALAMADLVNAHTDNPTVRALATEIRNAQQPEIDAMSARLTSWGVDSKSAADTASPSMNMPGPSMNMAGPSDAPAGGHGDHGSSESMPGMGLMSAAAMTALDKAHGTEFDKLWLQGMIEHHQGAIDMANTELAQGVDPDSRTLAQHVKTSQQAEIDRMRTLLK